MCSSSRYLLHYYSIAFLESKSCSTFFKINFEKGFPFFLKVKLNFTFFLYYHNMLIGLVDLVVNIESF